MEVRLGTKWLLIRLAAVALIVRSAMIVSDEKSNMDWFACFLVSFVVSACLFGWLTGIRSKEGIDWSEPYSWRVTFWPMNKYPLRYWILLSYGMMLGGAAATFQGVISKKGNYPLRAMFFFWGLFQLLALKGWIRKFAQAA